MNSKDSSVTPIDAWEEPFKEGSIVALPSKRRARLRHLNLVPEILAGTLPNRVLQHVVFAKPLEVKVDDPADKVAEHFDTLLNIAARVMVEPRLILSREPNRDKGEIGPSAIPSPDLYFIVEYGLWSQLPEVADAPFPPVGDAGDRVETPDEVEYAGFPEA